MLTDHDAGARENGQGQEEVEPFLRWAGGKRWLARRIAPILRRRLGGTYFEPFLGSGATFFALAPERAMLSDLNADLIGAFRAVARRPSGLLSDVRTLHVDAATYYRLRAEEPEDAMSRAVRFLYLNRTCYGGIYRENKRGLFNTPYGGGSRTTAPLWERRLIERCAPLLSRDGVVLEVGDFERSLDAAREGDVVYCDPAYRAATRSQFDRYGAIVFGWNDQVRLAQAAERARRRGALVVISNTHCPEVRELYAGSVRLVLDRAKAIGNKAKDPDRNREYLIVLDPRGARVALRSWGVVGLPEDGRC